MIVSQPLQILIEEFSKLPGVGRKTAQRLALFILGADKRYVSNLSQALIDLKEKIHFCKNCFNITTEDVCEICSNPKRDAQIICVVEEISDLFAIEKTNDFSGHYHVLGGSLSPLSGIGPDSLRINELLSRISKNNISEVILALNPDTEGETTTLYLANLLKNYDLKITRIARGLPIGSNLEFADDATISNAVISRIQL